MYNFTNSPARRRAPMVDSALDWARRGFRVFPARGKKPVVDGWIESASADPAIIREAWRRVGEDCNVGVLCGDGVLHDGGGLLVVDCDAHKAGAREALADCAGLAYCLSTR